MAATPKMYRIDLPTPAHGYPYVEMYSERADWEHGQETYTVVMLDIEKTLNRAAQSGQAIPAAPSEWPKDKEEYFSWAWNPGAGSRAGKLAHMPRVAAHEFWIAPRVSLWRKLLARLGLAALPEAEVEHLVRFGNGRHRAVFLLSQGVKVMPFECRRPHAELLQRLCA